MQIKSVSNNLYLNSAYEGKKIKDGKKESKIDSFELSDQARELSSKMDSQKLADIKQKIESNFYNSDEVISKISQKIYNVLKKS